MLWAWILRREARMAELEAYMAELVGKDTMEK
jgi:hypothetical protein